MTYLCHRAGRGQLPLGAFCLGFRQVAGAQGWRWGAETGARADAANSVGELGDGRSDSRHSWMGLLDIGGLTKAEMLVE